MILKLPVNWRTPIDSQAIFNMSRIAQILRYAYRVLSENHRVLAVSMLLGMVILQVVATIQHGGELSLTKYATPSLIGLTVGLLSGVAIVLQRQRLLEIKAAHRDQAQLLDRLQFSEARFRLAMKGANDGLWDWQLKANEVYYSPRWVGMLGYRQDELEPTLDTWGKLVHPDDSARVLKEVDDYVSGKSDAFDTEFRMRHKDGSWITILSRAFVEYDGEEPIRLVGTHVDITRRRKLLLDKETAEAQNEAKSAFLATMSHELRTPMNAVLGTTEILSQSRLDAQQHRMLSTIHTSSTALLQLIDDILDFSKIEAGKLSVEVLEVDLLKLVESVAEAVRPLADASNIRFFLDYSPDLPRSVKTDPTRVRQILLNLLGNAVKFSRGDPGNRDSVIEFRTVLLQGDKIGFRISDTGIGMSDAVRKRIFEPFVQGEESTTRKYGGTGLGLVVSCGLSKMLGGHIDVESEFGKGSTFTVTLPLDAGDEPVREPDVSGVTFVAYSDLGSDLESTGRFLRSRGVTYAYTESEAELGELIEQQNGQVIVGLSTWDESEAFRIRRILSERYEGLLFQILSVGRVDRKGLVEPDLYVIDRSPLLLSELLRSLAVLAGREAVEAPPVLQEQLRRDLANHTGDGEDQARMVLLVEDNLTNQDVISTQLKLLGYGVCVAGNGIEGLEKWQNGGFDLILSDCHMPEMDGFEMVETLRSREAGNGKPHIPIIAITANAQKSEADKCRASGMDDFLAKPVALSELKQTVDRWLAA